MEQITTEDFQIIDNCLMIRLPEEVDHHGAGFICENADRLLCREDVCNIVFDFENTRFMDSSGIGIIMGRYRKISCFGGRIYAIHADRQIRRILSISGSGVCPADPPGASVYRRPLRREAYAGRTGGYQDRGLRGRDEFHYTRL